MKILKMCDDHRVKILKMCDHHHVMKILRMLCDDDVLSAHERFVRAIEKQVFVNNKLRVWSSVLGH